jgi:uncharacterized iron-regulated membrane protein
MKDHFRQSMAWLHTWLGLLFGWVLYFMFVTGTAGYLDTEIDRWMRPELPAARCPLAQDAAIGQAQAYLQAHAGDARRWSITLPIDRNEPWLRVAWQAPRGTAPAASGTAYLDPVSGQPIETRDTAGGQTLYQMHWRLHYLPERFSQWIVSVATLVLLIALVTGIVVHKKIFADFFTFRPGKGQRSWLDAHNVASVVSLPFQVMITYSGLVFVMFSFMPLIAAAWYGPGQAGQGAFLNEVFPPLASAPASGQAAPLVSLQRIHHDAQERWGVKPIAALEIEHPNDTHARVRVVGSFAAGPLRAADILAYDGVSGAWLAERQAWQSGAKAFRDLMLGLHEGLFAAPFLRALYVLSGLLGAAMIATGLVLWTVKRRQRVERGRDALHAGLRLVERLNVAVVIGLPVAIGAYFWANRLLPIGMDHRADWEVHTLFGVWLLMFLFAALRPPARAWRAQALLAAIVFGALPVLNAMTTSHHLGRSLADRDVVMAGFDLVALALGAMFAGIARAGRRRALPRAPC